MCDVQPNTNSDVIEMSVRLDEGTMYQRGAISGKKRTKDRFK